MNDSSLSDAAELPKISGTPVVRLEPGERSFDGVIERLAQLVAQMRRQGQPDLLVDATVASFATPSLADRARMVRRWAEAAAGRVRIAIVARADFIDAERFGVVMARNVGLSAQVFAHERDALQWLAEERAAEVQRSARPSKSDEVR